MSVARAESRTDVLAIGYWAVFLGAAAGLAALDAHPAKIAGLVAATFAVRRFGLATVPVYFGLVLVLPEAGGPFPAMLSVADLLFWPLLFFAAAGAGPLYFRSPLAAAAIALAGASVWALGVGVALRGAAPRPAAFDFYQQAVHVGAFVLTAQVAREHEPQLRLFHGVVAGGAIAAAIGIAQVLGGESLLALQSVVAETIGYPAYAYAHVERYLWWGVRKAFAGFYSPNGLGAALMFSLLLVVGRELRTPSRLGRAAAVLLGAGLAVTFSRGAILAAAVSLAALAWRALRERRPETSVALLASAVLLPAAYGALLYGSTRATPVGGAIEGGGGIEMAAPIKRRSAGMKLDEARELVAMWADGIGVLGAGRGVVYRATEGFVSDAHGVQVSPAYVEIVYRSGLAGVLALLVMAIALRKVWRAHGPMGPRGHPLQPALFGALVHSAIDHPFLTVPGLVAIFWASWGVLEGSRPSRK